MNGFFGNLFLVLIYYFKDRDVAIEVVVGFTLDVNYIGYMTAMFLSPVSQFMLGLKVFLCLFHDPIWIVVFEKYLVEVIHFFG